MTTGRNGDSGNGQAGAADDAFIKISRRAREPSVAHPTRKNTTSPHWRHTATPYCRTLTTYPKTFQPDQ